MDVDTCLEAFGNHFLSYCQKNGYDKILRVLGSNLHDFLTNLDNLHDHLGSIYPGMRAPSFRVTQNHDGSMHLHYYSERKGLEAIVRGLVMVVSKEFFKTEVSVIKLDNQVTSDGHVILEVRKKHNDELDDSKKEMRLVTPQSYLSSNPKDLLFNTKTIAEAFPFHIMFDQSFNIIQMGKSLLRLTKPIWMNKNEHNYHHHHHYKHHQRQKAQVKFTDLFIIQRPVIDQTFDTILSYCNQVFVVKSNDKFNSIIQRAKTNQSFSFESFESKSIETKSIEKSESKSNKKFNQTKSMESRPSISSISSIASIASATPPSPVQVNLRLKGQMVPVPESNAILFLCSPRVNGLGEMKKLGLYLTDFPIHDQTRDLTLMHHQRRGERELVEKLDEATNHIKILDNKLREENHRTEEILHNIFPAKIAKLLCQNIQVEPQLYEPVTCLFSDIVGFTAMCGSPSIEPMDIVRLLNKLYIQFDNLTNVYGVYKIETIGDAYVVVGGVPEFVIDHADRIVQMGISMVKVTNTTLSPVDGKPIQVSNRSIF